MQNTNRHIRVTTSLAGIALVTLLLILPPALGAPPDKLRGGLTETSLESPQVQTFLIVPRSQLDVTAVSDMLDRMGADYSYKRIGEVIISNMPGENVSVLLANDEIKEVWPDLEVVSFDEEALTQVNARTAWGFGYTGEGQKIAILDTGIDASHPAFQDRVVLAQNFSQSPTVNDIHGHGTHVAGIAAGYGDANGVAPQALLFNGKVLNDSGGGIYSSVINGINWAVENGADVINLSLGGLTDQDTPLNQAVRDAMSAGVVVAVAAGNCGEGCPSGACGPFRGITMPGNTKEALTVGAVNSQNGHACFSAGEYIEGVGIKPDLVAPGVEILSSLPNGGQGKKTGTSMSTPFVAGASALARQAHPSFSSFDVKALLENISLDLGEKGKDILFGSGLLDLTRIESTDTNRNGGDENRGKGGGGGDANQMGENFFFYGPTELVKKENGEYEVEFIGGEGMSMDLWAQANEQDTTVQFTVFDELGTVIDYNTIGPVELNDGDLNHYRFLNNFAPDRVGNFTVEAKIYQNGELREGSLGAEENVLVASAEKNVFVTLPPDMIEVQEFEMPQQVDKGGVFAVQVPAKNTGLIDVNVFAEIMLINDQNSVAEVMDSTVVEIRAGEQEILEISGPVMVPSGDYNAKITIFFENQKTWAYSDLVVRIGSEPVMESFSLPQTMATEEQARFSVTLKNPTSAELRPSAYVFFYDGNEAARTFFDSNSILLPGERKTVEFGWLVDAPAKDYNVVVEAWTENTVDYAEQEVRIIDESPPVIEGIEFEPVVWKNAPNPVRVHASDFSKIKSIETVSNGNGLPMNRASGSDSNAEFTSAVKTTLALGSKRFRVRACDEFNNCAESAEQVFSVTPLPDYCGNKLSLLVVDDNAVNATRNGTRLSKGDLPGCSAEWSTKEHGFPGLAFLQRFDPVIWSTSNYFGPAIDGNEESLLGGYAGSSGGNLLVEGSDVSSEHPFDDFALNVLHSEFALEIGQDENFGGGNENNGGGEGGQGNWWSDDWNFTRPINYTGAHDAVDEATIFEFYLDTQALVSGEKLQADCDDLRIVSNHGGTPTEVEREVKNCNTQSTRIRHRSNYTVPADWEILAGDSNGYFAYYGNPFAQNPGHELRERLTAYTEVDQANKLAVTDYSVSTSSPITKSEKEWLFRQIPWTSDFNIEFTVRGTDKDECNNFINMCMTDDENVGSYYLNPKACVGLVSNGCNTTGLVPFIGHNNGRNCSGSCEGNGRGNIVNLGTDYYGRFARKGYDAVFELYTDRERTIPFTGMPLALGVGEFDSNVFFAFNHEYLGEHGDQVGGGFSDIYFRLLYTPPVPAIGNELSKGSRGENSGWWSDGFGFRKQVFIEPFSEIDSNNTLVFGIDTSELVSSGKMQPDCDDLRIVHSSFTEVDRKIVGCNTTDTNVFFRTEQADKNWKISRGEMDESFFAYYGNPGAANPPGDTDNIFEDSKDYFALYRFENDILPDSSPNNRHLTATGFPLLQKDEYFSLENEAVKSYPQNSLSKTGFGEIAEGTLEVLFEINKQSSNDIILTAGSNNSRLQLTAGGNQVMRCLSDGSPLINVEQYNVGEVHHFACTWNADWKKTYWDGELIDTTSGYSLTDGTLQIGGIEPTSSDETFITVAIAPFAKTSFNFLKTKPGIVLGQETTPQDQNNGGGDSNSSRGKIVFFETAPQEFSLESLDLNLDNAPYADAVTLADGNAIAIAGWDENHLAIVGFETCFSKTLFTSFSLSAVQDENRLAFLESAKNWLNAPTPLYRCADLKEPQRYP
ncbi:MAG: S8 family serine peptidase [Candidatus Diapherotrites archaeon]|nr:S8 family serine peptidase [Candidatus Diapherotrites archaeon]